MNSCDYITDVGVDHLKDSLKALISLEHLSLTLKR